MHQTALLIRLLTALLEVPVSLWDNMPKTGRCFETEHCFSSKIQTLMTADAMELITSSLKPRLLYEIQDRLGLRLFLFLFEENTLLVGPFVPSPWEEATGSALLASHGIPASRLVPYKLYYCAYPVLDPSSAQHTILSVLQELPAENISYQYRPVYSPPEAPGQSPIPNETSDFELTVKRYQSENEMLHMVRIGNYEGALSEMKKMASASVGMKLPYLTASNALSSINILRTLLRKAAESAGVHPAVVDAISQEYAQKAYAIRNASNLELLQREMLRAFCSAVKKVKQESYSSPIRRAADYISLHLNESLSLTEIAAAAQVTPNYLSHRFKEETGASVSEYIAENRCRKAAALLSSSQLPIQDISAYVGYPDSNYFVKVFKSVYHMTPSQYRKKHPNFSAV